MPAALRRIALVLALVAAAGCGWLKPQATPILPAEELYQLGENQLNEKRYEDARKSFTKIVERHPNSSYVPRAPRTERGVGGRLLHQPGQSERGPPASRAGPQGLCAHARIPRGALAAGRGEQRRGQA